MSYGGNSNGDIVEPLDQAGGGPVQSRVDGADAINAVQRPSMVPPVVGGRDGRADR